MPRKANKNKKVKSTVRLRSDLVASSRESRLCQGYGGRHGGASASATRVVLVLGGARSGKSGLAGELAETRFRNPLYLATAEALDAEMVARIELHKKARGSRWLCVEEPLDIARIISRPPRDADGILLDCLTLWLTNVLMKEGEKAVEPRKHKLIAALKAAKIPVILVSNEVGMGIVPESKLGRVFRDLAGRLNQDVAAVADSVVLVAAGLPLMLKGNVDLFGSCGKKN